MTAVVPLLAEALNLAITEHWEEVARLHRFHCYSMGESADEFPGWYEEKFSAGVEALAVALHARLQEQGTLP